LTRYAFEDLAWWIKEDRRKALRVIEIAKDIVRSPYEGIGKPEPLKHDLAGCWSRRIDQEHRIVYQVFPEKIRILACRFHY